MSLRRRLARAAGFAPPGGRLFGPGELRLALLALLAEAPGHGYDLMTRLEQRCGGAYQASAGAIYPTLQQLEDERLVRVEVGEDRKTYRLTADGRRELETNHAVVDDVWARAERRGEWGLFGDPDAAEIVAPALRLAKAALKAAARAHGDPEIIDGVRAILERARDEIERLARRKHQRR